MTSRRKPSMTLKERYKNDPEYLEYLRAKHNEYQRERRREKDAKADARAVEGDHQKDA